jgi:hypothetical protein
MLTENEMNKIAEDYVSRKASANSGRLRELMVFYEFTIKKDYGNIYFYNSKKFIETRDSNYALYGNGPFLVEKNTGKIIQFGTAESDEYYIAEYEAGRWVPAFNKWA